MTENTVAFDISDYITDAKAEIEGVWRSLGRDKSGKVREVKLSRLNNDEYNSMLRKKQKANQAVLDQQDDEAFKLAEQINKEVLANTIIRGLRVNGEEIPYTPTLGLELLKSRDFHARINALAGQMEAYKEKEDAEAVKS
jgi:hypothetical protein